MEVRCRGDGGALVGRMRGDSDAMAGDSDAIEVRCQCNASAIQRKPDVPGFTPVVV